MPVTKDFPVRMIMLGTGVATAALILAVMILSKGEVVRLITHDSVGQPQDTELWIVDLPEGSYLRAGSPNVKWLARLSSGAAASLERNGEEVLIETLIVDDSETRAAVHQAMAEKYGFSDRIWATFRSHDSIALRIHSLGAVTAPAHQNPRGVPESAQATP